MPQPPSFHWPPEDPLSFVRSEEFGSQLLLLCQKMQRTRRDLDFADAVAQVFEWLDKKLEQNPEFLNHAAFPNPKAFWAYLRVALLRVALLGKRQSRRKSTLELPVDSPVFEPSSLPEAMAQRDEIIDRLGSPCADILRGVLDSSDEDANKVAASLGMTRIDLEKRFEECLDRLRNDPEVLRRMGRKMQRHH